MEAEHKLAAYMNLVEQAERHAYWWDADAIFDAKLMAAFSEAALQAHNAGLSPEEIKAATLIGE